MNTDTESGHLLLLLLLRARQHKLRKHLSLEAYCSYIFWFNKRFPKDDVALTNQRLESAGDVLHCFSLHLAKSAGWISTKQAYNSQVSSYRSMSGEDHYHF